MTGIEIAPANMVEIPISSRDFFDYVFDNVYEASQSGVALRPFVPDVVARFADEHSCLVRGADYAEYQALSSEDQWTFFVVTLHCPDIETAAIARLVLL